MSDPRDRLLDPWSDLFGEEFERPDDMLLLEIAEEASHQLQAAEPEFGMEGGDLFGHRFRTADNRHFAQPTFGVVLVLGQNPAP
jgi:hypothetical protein